MLEMPTNYSTMFKSEGFEHIECKDFANLSCWFFLIF